jgi:hypothetical protein
MADTKDDLAVLFPAREVPLSTGETLTVAPFTFGQLPKAIGLMRPLTEALRTAEIASFGPGGMQLAADWPMRLPGIIDNGGEALIALLAFVYGKPRAWFDTLGADDGLAMARALLEVNGDFFVKRIAPTLGLAVAAVPTLDGATSPDGSTATATAGATSSA